MKNENEKEVLELKHLAPYLPYGLKGQLVVDKRDDFDFYDWTDGINDLFKKGVIWELCGYADKELNIPLGEGEIDGFLYRNGLTYCNFHGGIEPILRPLSDLNAKILNEIVGGNYTFKQGGGTESYLFSNSESILMGILSANVLEWEYRYFVQLVERHFDVFGLIPKGLAIAKNDNKVKEDDSWMQCDCGEPVVTDDYEPCCSEQCWHNKFD